MNDGKGGNPSAQMFVKGHNRNDPLDDGVCTDPDPGADVQRTNDVGRLISSAQYNGNVPGGGK